MRVALSTVKFVATLVWLVSREVVLERLFCVIKSALLSQGHVTLWMALANTESGMRTLVECTGSEAERLQRVLPVHRSVAMASPVSGLLSAFTASLRRIWRHRDGLQARPPAPAAICARSGLPRAGGIWPASAGSAQLGAGHPALFSSAPATLPCRGRRPVSGAGTPFLCASAAKQDATALPRWRCFSGRLARCRGRR